MSIPLTAIMGKGGVGKTFVATHLAHSLAYLGVRTLLIGADQKQDTIRAVSPTKKPSLIEALETAEFEYADVPPESVITRVTPYLDVMELGPSQLLVGNYNAVYDEAFHYFQTHHLAQEYQHWVFDVGEERWDAALLPLFRRLRWVIGVTDETAESLFVVNRLMRALLIGYHEYQYPARLLGLACNRAQNPLAFERYLEKTRVFPLLTLPLAQELSALRHHHSTLFAMQKPPRHLDKLITDFVKVGELLRGEPFNLNTQLPLPDEDIWKLPPAQARVN